MKRFPRTRILRNPVWLLPSPDCSYGFTPVPMRVSLHYPSKWQEKSFEEKLAWLNSNAGNLFQKVERRINWEKFFCSDVMMLLRAEPIAPHEHFNVPEAARIHFMWLTGVQKNQTDWIALDICKAASLSSAFVRVSDIDNA